MGFAETFKALSDPQRREILSLLKNRKLSAGDIAARFQVTGATVSYHLNVLKRAGMVFVGLMFMVVGNYLPKCRQNYTVGIKLPWTLSDEDNWDRTHRLAGPLWVAAGLAVLLCALLGAVTPWTVLIPLLAAALIPVGYSALLYTRKRNGEN